SEVIAIGDPWCAASAHWGLGWIDDLSGSDQEALRGYRRALLLWSDTGDRRGMFYAMEGIAVTLTRTGQFLAAAQLFAGANTIAPQVGSGSMSSWNLWRDRHLGVLRAALSPVELSAHQSVGERLELDVLVKAALMAR